MESAIDWHTAKALLDWHVELGATEAIGDVPVNRYELPASKPKATAATSPVRAEERAVPVAPAVPQVDPVAEARVAAQGAADLAALEAAIAAFPHCQLKAGARSTVFADGNPAARVMILGEAPGRDEDIEGKPFVGRAGRLLDRMFAAIGLTRGAPDPGAAFYISNIIPWRPPHNRDPSPEEIAMMMPFVSRHVELAQPDPAGPDGQHALCRRSGPARDHPDARPVDAGAGPARPADVPSRLPAAQPRLQTRGMGRSSDAEGATEGGMR